MHPRTCLYPLLSLAVAFLAAFSPLSLAAEAPVRIKDLADFEGLRDNMLIGYGLVVGLAGTGDSANSVPFTRQSLINMLERLGVNSKDAADTLKMKNVAAVMVTGKMPSTARQGSKLDITLSSLGDAKSLEGGTLMATPLVGADGNTYAVAQGSLIVGGFSSNAGGDSVQKNHLTVARMASGAVVERETGFEVATLGNKLRLMLRTPDNATAVRMRDAINKKLGAISTATDRGTIDVALTPDQTADLVTTMNAIENLMITPDTTAKVVIDEKTGTIVMGSDVRISDVAISHANLTIRISRKPAVSQPNPFAGGSTTVVSIPDIKVQEGDGHFQVMESGASLAEVVRGLNSLGVKPRDIISILQNIKAAGAMQAELVVL
jgi:flagellar P-ring protein precursor FlgI